MDAIGRRDRVFCYYTQTENFKLFDFRLLCSARILSRWVVATRQSQLNLAHARLSYS